MHIHIIGCRVLTRELSVLIPSCENTIAISWLPQGMHETPTILHKALIEELDRIYDHLDRNLMRITPDYIVMGYGLCANATIGLKATRIPLVVPRTDDCFALFLGSQARFLDCFSAHPGTFWLNSGWAENTPRIHEGYYDQLREHYKKQYDDEDMVDLLIEADMSLMDNYKNIGFIHSDTHSNERFCAVAKDFAKRLGFGFVEVEGNTTMLEKIVAGDFNERDFLIVQPGYKVEYSNGPERMIAVPATG